MYIQFNEKDHIYSLNGEIASISITELLHKHGLAPNYEGIPKSVLKASAKTGKEYHKEFEEITGDVKVAPKTENGKLYKEWLFNNVDFAFAEKMVGIELNGWTLCGTADLVAFKGKKMIIADHKTTSSFQKEYVSWQVSIIDYLIRHNETGVFNDDKNKLNINQYYENEQPSDLYCLWYNNGELKVKELQRVSDSEIERLFECERKGEIYSRKELVVDDDLMQEFLVAEKTLIDIQKQYEIATANAKEIREKLKDIMEKQGIIKWETPNGIKATYIPATERMGIDKTLLKKEFPKAYETCLKPTKVASQIRITLTGEENNE